MKIICDCHTHTINSFDAENTLKEMCQNAIDKGISILAVTDHLEAPELSLGAKSQYGDMLQQIKNCASDVELCREEFGDSLKILKGLELGEPMHNIKLTKKALGITDFDFILASVHNLKDYEDFYFLEYTEENVDLLLDLYFQELLDTTENADFDSLAHLTYPLRYIVERMHIKPDLYKYKSTIDDILKNLVEREKALEINTSGLFKPIGTTLPDINLVKRFKELGGKYVTIGSDAHNCENLGAGIEKGIDIAKVCGFKYYTIFEKRQPKLIEIWY